MLEFAASRRDISSLLFRLKKLCSDVVDKGFAGDHTGASTFISLNKGLIDTAEQYIKVSYELEDRSLIRAALKDAAEVADTVLKNLSDVYDSDASSIPYQVVRPLQRWFRSFKVTNDLFFRAEHSALYELWPYVESEFSIEMPSETLEKAISETRWPIQRVTVPSLSLATFPHFAIVAHEVGHAVYDKMKGRIEYIQRKRFRYDLFDECINSLLQRSLESDEQEILADIYASWLEEICADCFALQLVGPAYFFSFCSFVEMVNSGFGIGLYHPANFVRRQAMFDLLQEADGFGRVFEDVTGERLTLTINSPGMSVVDKYELFFQLKAVYGEAQAAILAALTFSLDEVIHGVRPAVRRVARRLNRRLIYTPRRFKADLENHLEAFVALIPPIEKVAPGRRRNRKIIPEDFAAILNVGWVASLSKLEKLNLGLGEDFDFRANFERSNLLLLKAVELSEARRAWEQANVNTEY